jgi:glutathione S-transferase
LREVSVARGENLAPAYLAVNPKGRVPALVIPGEESVLTEVPAILTFLARRHPGADMLPNASPIDEARCHEWLAWLTGWVHGVGYGALWRPGRFADDASLHPAIGAKGGRTVESAYGQIEEELADGRRWAIGNSYTIVDPFLLVLYRWGNRIEMPMRSNYPAWTALTDRMLERPAVRRAMDAERVTIDR